MPAAMNDEQRPLFDPIPNRRGLKDGLTLARPDGALVGPGHSTDCLAQEIAIDELAIPVFLH